MSVSGQTSSTSACQIKLHFHNSPVSAFYEQTINGTGCVTNLTTKDNQEVHVINLKKTGLAYRNDIAEVHLFVKSRNDDEGTNIHVLSRIIDKVICVLS